MAASPPIFVGITPGVLIPQEGGGMRTTQWGFDEGSYKYLTHPQTPPSALPQRSQRHALYTSCYVTDVFPRATKSTLVEINVHYKGLLSASAAQNKLRLLPSCDTTVFSIGALSSGKSINLVAPVPGDVLMQEYVTTTQPTRQGCGNLATPTNAGPLAGFTITFVVDPAASPPPLNYLQGWVLESRSWEDVAGAVFLVRERYKYYYNIGV